MVAAGVRGAMAFTYTPAQRAFRDRLCSFLSQALDHDARGAHADPDQLGRWSVTFTREFHCRLGQEGFIGVSWPREYGGQGEDPSLDAVLVRELEYHRGPNLDSGTISYLPPSPPRYCSDAQKREYLPRLARGEIEFFVGCSEPDAGSDLAGLQARAAHHGDGFILRGQKAFCSGAHMADYGWIAARTDPEAPKHRGISLFIIDMRRPGIAITASRTAGGWLHHAVYFDDVVAPRSSLVGELNAGWGMIMAAIDAERAVLASPGAVESSFDHLLAWAAPRARVDSVAAHTLARLAVDVEVVALAGPWLEHLRTPATEPEYETSLALIMKREPDRTIEAVALNLAGSLAPPRGGATYAIAGGMFEQDCRDQLYYHFVAGGLDITRNVIARRGLGLPS